MCELGECSYNEATELAASVVEQAPEAFNELGRAKLHELTLMRKMFENVAGDCPGMNEEGKCGKAMLISDTRNLLLVNPGMHINSKSDEPKGTGF